MNPNHLKATIEDIIVKHIMELKWKKGGMIYIRIIGLTSNVDDNRTLLTIRH